MTYTKAQKRAVTKYIKEKTDDIRLRTTKGLKERYKAEAAKRGFSSMTKFILYCVNKEIEDNPKT